METKQFIVRSPKTALTRSFAKYWAILKTQVGDNFVYGGQLALRSIAIILFLWIFTQLWRTTFVTQGQESISGLNLHDTLWYLLLAEMIMLSKPRFIHIISQAVRDGSIAHLLAKPCNFLLYQASMGLGNTLTRLVLNGVAGGTLVWIFVGPPPDPRGWPCRPSLYKVSPGPSWVNWCSRRFCFSRSH